MLAHARTDMHTQAAHVYITHVHMRMHTQHDRKHTTHHWEDEKHAPNATGSQMNKLSASVANGSYLRSVLGLKELGNYF